MPIKLYNSGFTRQYLALDPLTSTGYGLRASASGDIPLEFTNTSVTGTNFTRFSTTIPNADLLCLDVYGDDPTNVHLATCGEYLGQLWWWTGDKLSNNFTGDGWYLDVYSGSNEAFISQGDFLGHYWQAVDVNAEPTSVAITVTAAAPTSTTVIPPSTSNTFPATSVSSASSSSSGLSTGAMAGIGVGAGLGGVAAIAAAAFILFRRRRRKREVEQEPKHVIHEVSSDFPYPPQEMGHHESKWAKETPLAEMPSPVAELDGREREN